VKIYILQEAAVVSGTRHLDLHAAERLTCIRDVAGPTLDRRIGKQNVGLVLRLFPTYNLEIGEDRFLIFLYRLSEDMKSINHTGYLGVDERIILK
jgi:hypothetical protein